MDKCELKEVLEKAMFTVRRNQTLNSFQMDAYALLHTIIQAIDTTGFCSICNGTGETVKAMPDALGEMDLRVTQCECQKEHVCNEGICNVCGRTVPV